MSDLKGESSHVIQRRGQLNSRQDISGIVGAAKILGRVGSGLVSTEVSVVSYESFDAITVVSGTPKANIPLPETIEITLSNGQTNAYSITSWTDLDTYNLNLGGLYEFQAVINIPSFVGSIPTVVISVLVVYMRASGGVITTDGDFKIHTFNNSDTFSIDLLDHASNIDIDYLIVAGGGGGGRGSSSIAGGGGGGGQAINDSLLIAELSTDEYSVIIGNGGVGSSSDSVKGENGQNSSVFEIITLGGGGGGTFTPGSNGGTGGGGSGNTNDFPDNAGGVGSNGGDGGAGKSSATPSYRSAGGGGGATGNGADGALSANGGGAGGAGLISAITGSSVEYAKGGRGGDNDTTPSAGAANTGNGGGGGRSNTTLANMRGKDGGKGVVIIKYKFQN